MRGVYDQACAGTKHDQSIVTAQVPDAVALAPAHEDEKRPNPRRLEARLQATWALEGAGITEPESDERLALPTPEDGLIRPCGA